MRAMARFGLPALLVALGAAVGFAPRGALAQAAKTQSPPAGKAAVPRPTPAELSQPVATVNGDNITRGELINFLSQYQIPRGDEQQVYKDAVETLINTKLVYQFINRQKIQVPEDKLNDQIANLEKTLKQEGRDLPTALLQTNMSIADLRRETADRMRWVEYINQKGTDAELKTFVEGKKDLFNGTQVKVNHIMLKVDPKATPEEKDKIKKKLEQIKDDINGNKISFAEAANKYSEDIANSEGIGGDLGYIGMTSGFIEDFTNVAFKLNKGSISNPFETPYGYHLIQVTDRKEGTPFDLEQNKPYVKQVFAADLQKRVLEAERKTAKIDIKPMPADLFPPIPAGPGAAAPAPAPAPAATKPAGAPK